jgi:hypothetical protein
LLIQRCEGRRGFGSFFVRGVILPDESMRCTTNVFLGRGRRGDWYKTKPPPEGAAATFLSGPSTIFFRLQKGIRILVFSRVLPWHSSKFFRTIGSGSVFRFGFRFGHLAFRTWIVFTDNWIVNGLSRIGLVSFLRIGSISFSGCGSFGFFLRIGSFAFQGFLDRWFLRIWTLGFSGSGSFGFSDIEGFF